MKKLQATIALTLGCENTQMEARHSCVFLCSAGRGEDYGEEEEDRTGIVRTGHLL